MLEVVNSTIQTIAANASAALGTVKIKTGCTVDAGATSLRLNRAGFYLVNITGAIGNLTNTAVRLAVVNNTTGILEQGGILDIAGLTAGATNTIPFSINVLVHVPEGCRCVQNAKSLSVRNLSLSPVTVTNLNTVVTKIA